jgi:hypothetical protein
MQNTSISVLLFFASQSKKRLKKEKKCTAEVMGEVVQIIQGNLDAPAKIVVVYTVDDKQYTVKEGIVLKGKTFGQVTSPVGMGRKPVMGYIWEGIKTPVLYNPDKPEESVIKNNKKISIKKRGFNYGR